VKSIFGSETSWTEIDQSCIENNIDIIVVNDEDTLWKYLLVLDQARKPIYQNPFYAVYSCRKFVKP
jgi:hypothetical protein